MPKPSIQVNVSSGMDIGEIGRPNELVDQDLVRWHGQPTKPVTMALGKEPARAGRQGTPA